MSLHADLERKKIFFRKNGEQCIALDYDASNLYPCIGMHSLGEAVQIIARDVWKSNSVPDVSNSLYNARQNQNQADVWSFSFLSMKI